MQTTKAELSEQDIRPLFTDPEKPKPKVMSKEELEEMRQKAQERIQQFNQMKKM